jgi:ribonuclease P protein component
VLAVAAPGQPARLGLAIAKRQIRKAVARNRLKRLVREAFRHDRVRLDGLDLVVMARTAATAAPSVRLRTSLQRHFERLAARSSQGTA